MSTIAADKKTDVETARTKKRSLWRDVWRRLYRNKLAVAAMVLMVIIILSAVFAEWLTPYDYAKQDPNAILQYPSWEHPFGTDNFGRDILARVLKGGQTSLLIALISTLAAALIGSVLGSTSAYFKGPYATFVMRLMDVIMGIPPLLFAVCISTALGTGVVNTIIATTIPSITSFCRISYAQVLKESNNEYIQAATICGAKDLRKVFVHLLPNSLAPIIIQMTLRLGQGIMIISSLSFVGLGGQPPTPEWGSIISGARQYIRDFWPIVTFPGLAIALTVISFNVFGDGLRDALDPRQK
jgi:peptide/nickel transport system permease protein